MELKTIGDVVVNVKHQWSRTIDVIFQDKPFRKPIRPVSDFDLINLDVVDKVVDKISLSGISLATQLSHLEKGIKDPLFSKDLIKISLGNKDTLVVKDLQSDTRSTKIDAILGKGEQSLDISDMDLRRQWYVYSANCIGDIRQAFGGISTINVQQLDKQDHVVFNDNTQDIRFVQGINSIRVDVIEQGGSFKDPGDYLGRLFFDGSDMSTVKEAFKQEIYYNL